MWTSPASAATGLLCDQARFHCTPVSEIEQAGRLWFGMERITEGKHWGFGFSVVMLSVPALPVASATHFRWSAPVICAPGAPGANYKP